jgi:hypothetical protein
MIRFSAVVCCLLLVAQSVHAQANQTLHRAERAYEALDYEAAINLAIRALEERLSGEERVRTHELLGFMYGALDSTRQAVDHFRELIFLDPDREPDVNVVTPRITSLYASALGQVLVVRRLSVDSASFVAGNGGLGIRFQLSRPARAIARVIGNGYDEVVDSQLVAGSGGFDWRAVTSNGDPVPPGDYQIVVTAVEGGNEYAAPVDVTVTHAPVDTVEHLTSLPGYEEMPETEVPPRDWRPLGIAVLYAGLSGGAVVALEHSDLGVTNREIISVGVLSLITGFVMSVKRPEARPVPANIRYNQLLREDLARRNAQIAMQNAERRREVRLTIVPQRVPLR